MACRAKLHPYDTAVISEYLNGELQFIPLYNYYLGPFAEYIQTEGSPCPALLRLGVTGPVDHLFLDKYPSYKEKFRSRTK